MARSRRRGWSEPPGPAAIPVAAGYQVGNPRRSTAEDSITMTTSDPGGTGRSAPGDIAPSTEPVLADAIADALLAHPAVARLDGGPFGTVASYLPGRRVVGVRAAEPGAGVEVAVVVRLGRPLPEVVDELRDRVRRVAGAVPVDVTIADVTVDGETTAR